MKIGIIREGQIRGTLTRRLATHCTSGFGDDAAAKSVVLNLVDELGFDGFDVGP